MSSATTGRRTISLCELESGWSFDLHLDCGRVWLLSSPSDTPVDLAFIFTDRTAAFERAVASCASAVEMCAVARRFTPARIRVGCTEESLSDAA
jgi:hypothetical protein